MHKPRSSHGPSHFFEGSWRRPPQLEEQMRFSAHSERINNYYSRLEQEDNRYIARRRQPQHPPDSNRADYWNKVMSTQSRMPTRLAGAYDDDEDEIEDEGFSFPQAPFIGHYERSVIGYNPMGAGYFGGHVNNLGNLHLQNQLLGARALAAQNWSQNLGNSLSITADAFGKPGSSKKKRKKGQDNDDEGIEQSLMGETGTNHHTVTLNATNHNQWCFLRKGFNKRDDVFVEHLFEIHEKFCEQCKERIEMKKSGKGKKSTPETNDTEKTAEKEEKPAEEEETEEELEMKRLMGFGGFKTTKGSQVEDNNYGSVAIDENGSNDQDCEVSTLTKEEKKIIALRGGFSVFKQPGAAEGESDSDTEIISDNEQEIANERKPGKKRKTEEELAQEELEMKKLMGFSGFKPRGSEVREYDLSASQNTHKNSKNATDKCAAKNATDKSAARKRPSVLEEEPDEELEMRKLMGFGGFKTTKGSQVEDNSYGTVTSIKTAESSLPEEKNQSKSLTESERELIDLTGGFSVFKKSEISDPSDAEIFAPTGCYDQEEGEPDIEELKPTSSKKPRATKRRKKK